MITPDIYAAKSNHDDDKTTVSAPGGHILLKSKQFVLTAAMAPGGRRQFRGSSERWQN
jgi:hypothetical protein